MKTRKIFTGIMVLGIATLILFGGIYGGAKYSELSDTVKIEVIEHGTMPDGNIMAEKIYRDGFGREIDRKVFIIYTKMI